MKTQLPPQRMIPGARLKVGPYTYAYYQKQQQGGVGRVTLLGTDARTGEPVKATVSVQAGR